MAALPFLSAWMPRTASFAPSRPATGGGARRQDPRNGSLFDLSPTGPMPSSAGAAGPASPAATPPGGGAAPLRGAAGIASGLVGRSFVGRPFVAPPLVAPPPVAIPSGPATRSGIPERSIGPSIAGSTRDPSTAAPVAAPPAADPSPLARTEAALRDAGLAGRFWRGDTLSTSPLPSTPSGFRLLDAELPGGGWPSRCLTELLLAHPGAGEIRFLAATLSALTQAGREVVLLAPPHIPDPTGWQQLGIDMRRVLVVHTTRPADRLWALEESLKSSAFGALVAWLPEDRALARHDALRRLQSAAASADGLTFLMRPSAAQYHASPAPLRMTLANGPLDGTRRTLSVRLLKRRGPVLARALTLRLPEIHPGLRPFGLVTPRGADGPRRTTGSTATPARRDLSSIDPHALAGAPLSDAAA